jgi:2'-5' RNA ligase
MTRHTVGVAIAVPPPFGEQLQDWRDRLGDPLAQAIPPHVTLLPPTVVHTHDLPTITDHLATVARGERGFPMVLRGTGTFRPVSPVVFVQVAEGISACERLETKVRTGPLRRELKFPYHPHVTIAHDIAEDDLDRAFEKLTDYRASFDVDGFSLYEHGRDGVWRTAQAFTFGG